MLNHPSARQNLLLLSEAISGLIQVSLRPGLILGLVALSIGLVAVSATAQNETENKTYANGIEGTNYGRFEVSGLTCIIGDNMPLDKHHSGHNGVYRLTSPACKESPFSPILAGLNLEHYFDGGPPLREVWMEPRRFPMTFRRLSETAAELYQPKTPYFAVESWTRFELKEPHYIDFSFRCIAHRDDLVGKTVGVFWASYINIPLDKSIYFLRHDSTLKKPKWLQLCAQEHSRDSTVRHETDPGTPFILSEEGMPLYQSFSPLRFSVPFFYGRFRNMVLIYIFQPGPLIRFSHSPTGGGSMYPAWDFQFVVPEYEAGREYGLKGRLVYKPWVDRADVLAEVAKYIE